MKAIVTPLMVFLMISSLVTSIMFTCAYADVANPSLPAGAPIKIGLAKSNMPTSSRDTISHSSAMRVCGDHMCAPFENPVKSLTEVMKQNRTSPVFNQTHTGYQATTPVLPGSVAGGPLITSTAPVAMNDFYTTTQSGILDIHSPGVLANDDVTEGKNLTASLVEDVRNGTLILHQNGGFTYIPNVKFYGDDSFQYSASDGSHSSVGTTTITVQRHIPISQNDFYVLDENSTLTVPGMGLLDNDSSSSGKPLTAIIVKNVEHGKLTLQQTGSFTYKPNPKFHGFDFFTYKANDGTVSGNISNVTLEVQQALPSSDNPIIKLIEQELRDLKNQYANLESRLHQLEIKSSSSVQPSSSNTTSPNTIVPHQTNPQWRGD
jgi:hypothetical protein